MNIEHIESGETGDVYLLHNKIIEKITTYSSGVYEINEFKKLQGLYGIPKFLYKIEYKNCNFKGKYNKGVLDRQTNKLINKGKGIGICMEYVGKYTLDDHSMLMKIDLEKILFNACFIAYEMWTIKKLNHGDLHRRNVIFDECKSFQKTYIIGKTKFTIRNQRYKVYLVDFEHCSSNHEMYDIANLCLYFPKYKTNQMKIEDFFKKKFSQFIC
uniref:Protein kinase domain-containing protein n=1 Tax=viral metagenome TaxID=1070528 RepID=A0A6C0F9Y0_9ZZZZ|tara:strand:- start:4941 stop:5579 length:639 start_codon:yes stop_codon:yes gene_type:complete